MKQAKAQPHIEQGKHMARARESLGFTSQELAKQAGISHATVYSLEKGRVSGSMQVIRMLADTLGISIDEYIGHVIYNRPKVKPQPRQIHTIKEKYFLSRWSTEPIEQAKQKMASSIGRHLLDYGLMKIEEKADARGIEYTAEILVADPERSRG